MGITTRYRETTNLLAAAAALLCLTSLPVHAAKAAELFAKMQPVVQQGKKIFMQPTFGGNGKACNSCHRNGGVGPGALPDGTPLPSLSNAAAIFPRFNRKGRLTTLEDQVRNCVAGAIEATPPAYDSDEMRLLVVYLTSLSQGKAIDMGGKPH